ncbi:STAS domain-containing protein [Streptomyces sp. NPDC097704]|uniref:STAS domain-containing protein n=1 Tax=Streptomyces sp. NPDC097704 TaxID=3157101 RepID=UPI00332E1E42
MTSHPEHAVVFEPGSERALARVSGEIDRDDATEVREALTAALDASRIGLDVDLTAVSFCDSSGPHALLDPSGEARAAGKTLSSSPPSADPSPACWT